MQVCDDGIGITPPGINGGSNGSAPGHGLESMRKRVADLGGRITVDSTRPQGTRVDAVLPLEVS